MIYVVQKQNRYLKPFGFIKGVYDKCISKYEYFGGYNCPFIYRVWQFQFSCVMVSYRIQSVSDYFWDS